MYDLAIIGGGPAGAGAGVYAARKKLKTVVITEDFGGQSEVSPDIQNWIGTISISGQQLAKDFKEHVLTYAEDHLQVKEGQRVEKLEKSDQGFLIKTGKEEFTAKTILIATGSDRRKLKVPGADKLEHKGITYCASCDGPMFSGKDVAVIGGGNAGFETASQLLAYANSVTLLHRDKEYKAEKITTEKVLANQKMTGILNADTTEVIGDNFVDSLKYKDLTSGEEKELKVQGVFVEIGQIPNTGLVEDLLDLDEYKRIKIDFKNQKTSVDGIWAAGDCTNILYHQNNIAAGDGVRALEDIYLYLNAS